MSSPVKPVDLRFQYWLSCLDDAELVHQGWSVSKLKALKDRPETLLASDVEGASVILYRQIVKDHFEILFLATLRHYRKQGRLMALLREFIRQHQPCLIWLECRSDNLAALDLYRKCGFKEDGVRRGYYSDGASAVCMSYSLEAESQI